MRDEQSDYKKKGVTTLGMNPASVESHERYTEGFTFNFPLVSDEDGKVCEKYETWIEKSLYGRKYMGIDRATFLIDKDGVVRRIWRKVKVAGHVDEVQEALKAL